MQELSLYNTYLVIYSEKLINLIYLSVDPEQELSMSLWTDNLRSSDIDIHPGLLPYSFAVKFFDSNSRAVHVHVMVKSHYGKALKVL